MSDLKHWVWWLNSLLTLLTKVVIWSDCALVSDTDDWISVATITNQFWMDNSGLICLFLFQMFNQKLLVLRGAAFADLVAQNLLEIFEKLVVDFSSSIAFFTWKAFLVNHFTVTLKALR
jgi:hypothetical protein